jgi:hypothetical protein
MKRLWTWLASNAAPLQAVASIVIVVGTILAYTQVKLIYSQSQAATMLTITKTEDELFEKIWDDHDLRQILERRIPRDDAPRVRGYVVILLNHFETVYRELKLGQIPVAYWREIEITLRLLVGRPAVEIVWHDVRCVYPADFRAYIDQLADLPQQTCGGTASL